MSTADTADKREFFEELMDKATWTAPSGIAYIVRYCKGGQELWVLGAVWSKLDNKQTHWLAFWASNPDDDSHVEFYVRDNLQALASEANQDFSAMSTDLEGVTAILCEELCPPLCDVFDDGSGITRDLTFIPSEDFTSVAVLDTFYSSHD
eukprot:gene18302-13151_t